MLKVRKKAYKLTLREVQDWMRTTGKGYKRAAEHFGVPEGDLRALKSTAFAPHPGGPGRGGAEPYRPSAGSDLGDEDDTGDESEVEDEPSLAVGAIQAPDIEALDPATTTTEDFLAWRLRFEIGMVTAAVEAGSPNVARNWEIVSQRTRIALDQHREDLRRAADARGRGDISDPHEIAKRVLKRARELVNLAPEECEDVLRHWAKALRFDLTREEEDHAGQAAPHAVQVLVEPRIEGDPGSREGERGREEDHGE